MTRGVYTTEFWVTIAGKALALLVAVGVLSANQEASLTTAFANAITGVFAIVSLCSLVKSYVQARTDLKRDATDAAAPDIHSSPALGKAVAPLLLAALALALFAGDAPAQCLPWRRDVQRQLNDLRRQQQPAPAPIAPQLPPAPPPAQHEAPPQTTDPLVLKLLDGQQQMMQQLIAQRSQPPAYYPPLGQPPSYVPPLGSPPGWSPPLGQPPAYAPPLGAPPSYNPPLGAAPPYVPPLAQPAPAPPPLAPLAGEAKPAPAPVYPPKPTAPPDGPYTPPLGAPPAGTPAPSAMQRYTTQTALYRGR